MKQPILRTVDLIMMSGKSLNKGCFSYSILIKMSYGKGTDPFIRELKGFDWTDHKHLNDAISVVDACCKRFGRSQQPTKEGYEEVPNYTKWFNTNQAVTGNPNCVKPDYIEAANIQARFVDYEVIYWNNSNEGIKCHVRWKK